MNRPELPLPERIECSTWVPIPDRVLRDDGLETTDKLVFIALCALARDGVQHAIAPDNGRIAGRVGISARAVQYALGHLEARGYVRRLGKSDALGLDTLQLVGYRDPWAGRPARRPGRAIVLLWRLPELPSSLREGCNRCTPRHATVASPQRRPGRDGGRR